MNLMRSGDFYVARLTAEDGRVLSENLFLFMNFKSVKMPPATVTMRVVRRDAERAVLALTTDVFAHCVRLTLPDGLEPDDNCMDILPGSTRELVVRGDTARLGEIRIRWRNR